jgi:elongation factor 1-alpha
MDQQSDKAATTDVAFAVAGSVDSGKSTFVGVLLSNKLDNGNGLTRACVAKHPHEIKSGKTSDVSTRTIRFDEKAVTLIDLCGHQQYLKTTTFGITGHFPDYAFVIVAANRGILQMTKEHLGILFHMQVPVVILITRIDIAPDDIYEQTITKIKGICKLYNKKPIFVNGKTESSLSEEDLKLKEDAAKVQMAELANQLRTSPSGLESDELSGSESTQPTALIPVITISNKTGYFIEPVREFIKHAQPRKLWDASELDGSVFYIDSVFNPPGIGLVLSGIVKGKTIKVGDTLYLGPKGKDFVQVRVKSLHNNVREQVNSLSDHQRGCIAIATLDKKADLTRESIQKGMIVVSNEKNVKNICYRFKARIEVLHHPATITNNYSPMLHIGPIRQTARMVINKEDNEGKDSFAAKDIAVVTFKFKYKPEFMEIGSTFFFREGTTRGVGKVTSVVSIQEDTDPNPDPIKTRYFRNRRNRNKQNAAKSVKITA